MRGGPGPNQAKRTEVSRRGSYSAPGRTCRPEAWAQSCPRQGSGPGPGTRGAGRVCAGAGEAPQASRGEASPPHVQPLPSALPGRRPRTPEPCAGLLTPATGASQGQSPSSPPLGTREATPPAQPSEGPELSLQSSGPRALSRPPGEKVARPGAHSGSAREECPAQGAGSRGQRTGRLSAVALGSDVRRVAGAPGPRAQSQRAPSVGGQKPARSAQFRPRKPRSTRPARPPGRVGTAGRLSGRGVPRPALWLPGGSPPGADKIEGCQGRCRQRPRQHAPSDKRGFRKVLTWPPRLTRSSPKPPAR